MTNPSTDRTDTADAWATILAGCRTVDGSLAAAAPTAGTSWVEFQVLDRIIGDPLGLVGIGRLADHVGLSGPSLTRIADRLADRGLVERHHSPTDRRVVLVGVTEAGRTRWAQARRCFANVLRQHVADVVGPGGYAALIATARRLTD